MSLSIREVQTRFLWPFEFERANFERAGSVLCVAKVQGAQVWKRAEPTKHYQDEYLDHTRDFLFGSATSGCKYFVLDSELGERWFSDCELDMGHGVWKLLRLVPGLGIELFLSPHGTGVLSLTLAPSTEGLTTEVALNFNYRLAQHRRRLTAMLRKRHPAHDPAALARIPREQRERVSPIPSQDAALEQQLGIRGGSFDMGALIELVLRPLQDVGYRPTQQEFCVYTVARLGLTPVASAPQVLDLSDLRARPELGPLLSALCQVEESGHAGSPPGEVTADYARLNRLHVCAVGALGAAHLVADQGGVGFDDQRLVTVRDKYFPAYLVALFQRNTLNTDIRQAGKVSKLPQSHAVAMLDELRQHLLDFAIRGNSNEVSSRNAVQRFYELARTGMRVEKTWSDVRIAIQDIDAHNASRQQTLIAERTEKHLEAIKHVQRFLHVLEYVLISVYFAHLFDMLHLVDPEEEHGWHMAGVLSAAAIGFLLVLFLDKWVFGGKKPS